MKLSILILLIAGICSTVEPADKAQLQIPDGAVQVDATRISFPLAHKAKKANLLFKKMAGDRNFCILRPDQAGDLAGSQYKEKSELQTILVKWSFIEPKNTQTLHLVNTHAPIIFSKDSVIYVSSKGTDIGDVAKVVEGVFIMQVDKLPKKITHKMSLIGW